ncbi:hypothetical protein [Polymorphobacter fuscus]|uniref:Uncharacterized protein n=1 Tax=Sandarakinorhabdus fusca TaxID=1439888 RepID=A0A7C9KLI5_9SPHN|nr:hypothetical protein [Polymorphobacter fuscus]KAB7647857.1 hypothetical protein F9290_07795 [Polymorphobacter fuscus]MQT17163.1 hypothetical protein [Polymorphobacter fuscus]NJC08843.1 hypothetical protein [Polymorphobacter fuscus]
MSGTMVFIIIIVAIVTVGRIVKAGLESERRKGGKDGDNEALARLERENAALRQKLERLEGRTAVLERIATDAPARLTAQIDEL